MKPKNEYKLLAAALMSLILIGCSDNGDDTTPAPPGPAEDPAQDEGQEQSRSSLDRMDLRNNVDNAFYVNGEGRVAEMSSSDLSEVRGAAKNVILFVGDGMGPSTVTAARIRDGELKGMTWEDGVSRDFDGPESNDLSFDRFPFAGLAKTYNTNSQVPDSAGTMGAMVTGVKTDIGVFGYDQTVVRGDCTTGNTGNQLVTSLELAEIAGMSTGIISTARITHATPGANYAKSVDRNYEDISDIPASGNCFGVQEDIASQLISFETRLEEMGYVVDGIDVVMGGGRRHFLPNSTAFNVEKPVNAGAEGDRTDGRDLPSEWQALYPEGVYVTDNAGFNAINTEETDKVFGLFQESHMNYELDRSNDIAGEPSLSEMTSKAIRVLDNNPNGYFLQIESGRIDHAHHAGNAAGALADTIEFARAVQTAVDLTSDEDTLILVTADHSHVFTIGGYVKRGNPILGKAIYAGSDAEALAADGLPFTTLGYTNGRGFCDLGSETDSDAGYGCAITSGRVDISSVDTEAPGYHQEALIPLSSETHAGEDVAVYASGPGASLVRGTNEQNVLFHITDYALDLIARANAAAN
ncbi:alkaline phosphatase [Marinobacter salarius]|uniref:alkaline phosphatase n=1 Tax=Marinobacter salarius TaxID=1420917 RepID=UPI0032ED6CD2